MHIFYHFLKTKNVTAVDDIFSFGRIQIPTLLENLALTWINFFKN